MSGVSSVIHSIGGVLQNQRHLHQLFLFGLWVGVMLMCWIPAGNNSNLGMLAILPGTRWGVRGASPEENLKKRSQMVASDGIFGKDIDL